MRVQFDTVTQVGISTTLAPLTAISSAIELPPSLTVNKSSSQPLLPSQHHRALRQLPSSMPAPSQESQNALLRPLRFTHSKGDEPSSSRSAGLSTKKAPLPTRHISRSDGKRPASREDDEPVRPRKKRKDRSDGGANTSHRDLVEENRRLRGKPFPVHAQTSV